MNVVVRLQQHSKKGICVIYDEKKTLPRETVIGIYLGEIIHSSQQKKIESQDYLMKFQSLECKEFLIDAFKKGIFIYLFFF